VPPQHQRCHRWDHWKHHRCLTLFDQRASCRCLLSMTMQRGSVCCNSISSSSSSSSQTLPMGQGSSNSSAVRCNSLNGNCQNGCYSTRIHHTEQQQQQQQQAVGCSSCYCCSLLDCTSILHALSTWQLKIDGQRPVLFHRVCPSHWVRMDYIPSFTIEALCVHPSNVRGNMVIVPVVHRLWKAT